MLIQNQPPLSQTPLSVSELNRMARLALEKGLASCWVRGELSNFTRAASGHWYFTVKDATASARCVMFRPRNQFVDWRVREGEQVELRAQATIYEARGDFQLVVDAMRQAGLGSLYEAFLHLKEKLEKEGLFDPARKRPLPVLPARVGIITSPHAAALRDVLTTLARRWPLVRAIIYPCQVQGDAAPEQIVQAVHNANQRQEVDTLLLVRGGGSLEDLQAFNQESVVRAMAASAIPIITGIGHETDFTIADFVADLRAPTPTGAAERLVPDRQEWTQRLWAFDAQLSKIQRNVLEAAWQRHDYLLRRLRHPREALALQREHTNRLLQRLLRAGRQQLSTSRLSLQQLHRRLSRERPRHAEQDKRLQTVVQRLQRSWALYLSQLRTRQHNLLTQLDLLCPDLVLRRGYSIVRSQAGEIVTDPEGVSIGQSLDLQLAAGHVGVIVERK